MVYRGVPSKGCQLCRKRKIRCDLRPDGCENCRKGRHICPGYRNQLDLQFCNENERVVRKARAKGSTESSPSPQLPIAVVESPESPKYDNALDIWDSRVAAASFKLVLPTPAEDVALAYFFSNHTTRPGSWIGSSTSCARGMSTESYGGLTAGMKALGLAGCSNGTKRQDLMLLARRHYLEAIQHTNAALASPTAVKEDSTLLSTIILTYFEIAAGGNKRSLDAWISHVNGTSALLELRGVEQFQTWQGVMLYWQATANIITVCLGEALPMPKNIHELTQIGETYLSKKDDPMLRISKAMLLLVDLRHDASKGLSDPDSLIARAIGIDAILLSVFSGAPREWSYESIVPPTRGEYVLTDQVHIYCGFFATQVWNMMRSSRIVIHRIILMATSRAISELQSAKHTVQAQVSIATLYQMQQDILATIPQYLGLVSLKEDVSHGPRSVKTISILPKPAATLWGGIQGQEYNSLFMRGREAAKLPVMRLNGGYTFMWSLYMAGSAEVTNMEEREGVIRVLRLMADTMGVRQAGVFADMLTESPDD